MTYRRDSEIYSSQYYGTLRRKNSSKIINILPVLFQPGTLPQNPVVLFQSISNTKATNLLAKKTKLVTWFISNCASMGRRELFFKKLSQKISIDVYDACGNLKCLPWNGPECDKLLDVYKFYITAENSLCPDSLTEKFYRALEAGVVPIVYGVADYSAYAPPHSFINAADFESPEALADYLIILDRNPRLYVK